MFTPQVKPGIIVNFSAESASLTHSLRKTMMEMGEVTSFSVTASEANVDPEILHRTMATLRAYASSLRRKEAIKENGKYSYFHISYLKNQAGEYVLAVSRGVDKTPQEMQGAWEAAKLKGRGRKKKNKDEVMQVAEVPVPEVDVRVPVNMAFSA